MKTMQIFILLGIVVGSGLSFVIQSPQNIKPKKRKLSFMEIFTQKSKTPKNAESGESVKKVMNLLQLADSFAEDPNFSVNVEVYYKNSQTSPNKKLAARMLTQGNEKKLTKEKMTQIQHRMERRLSSMDASVDSVAFNNDQNGDRKLTGRKTDLKAKLKEKAMEAAKNKMGGGEKKKKKKALKHKKKQLRNIVRRKP